MLKKEKKNHKAQPENAMWELEAFLSIYYICCLGRKYDIMFVVVARVFELITKLITFIQTKAIKRLQM